MTVAVATVLTHISTKKHIGAIREASGHGIDWKPAGFWYSVDGDWERWCQAEEWGISGTRHEHEVVLGNENILRIRSVAGIDRFHTQYRAIDEPNDYRQDYIDWRRVAEDYDGIEIAPYQYKRRLEGAAHRWYYTWDCASGCIWRPKGVVARFKRTLPSKDAKDEVL